MNIHDATETAYKNGYAKGYVDAKAEVVSKIFAEIQSKLTLNRAIHCGQKFYHTRLEDDIAEIKKKYTEDHP